MTAQSSGIRRRYHFKVGGIVFLLVAVFIGIAAFNSQANLLFWTFGLMIGALITSGLVSGAMLSGLRVRRLLPDHGAVDEPLVIRYEVVNTNRFIPCFGLVIHEVEWDKRFSPHEPKGWVQHVGPGAKVQAEAVGYARHRGAIDFQRVRISTTLPFGIMRKSISFPLPGRLIIFPRLYRVHRGPLNLVRFRDPSGNRPSPQSGGHEEFYGLREYRQGDPLKVIDWKHSARTGEMVSRELTRQTPPRLMLVLNLSNKGEAPYDSAERAISFAASVVCEAHREGYEIGLVAVGADCGLHDPRHSRWHRVRMLHALGEIDLEKEGDGAALPRMRDTNWLVIHAGEIDRSVGPAGASHVSDASMEEWCIMPENGAATRVLDDDAPPSPETAAEQQSPRTDAAEPQPQETAAA